MGKKNESTSTKKESGSVWSIFSHADGFDLWLMMLGLVGSIGSGFTIPIVFFLTSHMMNNIGSISTLSPDVFLSNINKLALVHVYLACSSFLTNFLAGYFWTRTSERQASRMRVRYLKAVLRQDVAYFDLHMASMSEVITSVSNDSSVLQGAISEKVPNLLENASFFVGSYVAAFVMLWRLAIVAVPFVVVLVIPGLVYGRSLMRIAREMREEYDVAGAIAEQAVSSVRTVYSFVGERRSVSEFSAALEGSLKLGLKQGFVKGLAMGSKSINYAIWSFVSYYSSMLVMHHGAQGGTVFAAGVLMSKGGVALGSAMANFKGLSEACSSAERVMEMVKRVPKIDSASLEGEKLENVSGEVEFSHVEFAYPSRPESLIFKDFSLNIPSGETVALVGRSGSGKSTGIALLQRFYDPLGGEIRLDGASIDKLQLKWLRSQMGLVSQEPSLFATTIRENILFGKEDADMEEVVEAAKASNAHDFISKLPLGYDTQVGERGVQMSGGQKQRIAIARAIIKLPRILLLDEATSALDSESERIVQNALDNASVDLTTVIVAHRLSTVRNAHTIAVFQDGQVIEKGSHDELVSHPNGLYTSLVRLQQTNRPNDTFLASIDTDNTTNQRVLVVSQTSSIHLARGRSFQAEDVVEPRRETKAVPSPSFWRLLAMNGPEWKQASVGCVSAAMVGGVQAAHSVMLGSMITLFFLTDHNEIKRKTSNYSLFFLGQAVYSFVVNIFQHYNFAYMGEYLTKRLREKMLAKILTFEVGWFDRDENSTGAVCSRIAKDANVVRSLVGERISLLVQTISTVSLSCTIGVVIAWRLALVMIAIQPLIILCFYTQRVLLKNTLKKAVKSQDESSKLAAEAVSNLRTVTAFSSQNCILTMLEAAQEEPRRESIRQSWYAGLALGLSICIMTCMRAFTFWYAGKLIVRGLLSSRAMFQTFLIMIGTGQVIADAGSMTTDLTKGADTVALVFAVLDRATEIDPESPEGHRPKGITGLVELRAVHFAYPARPDVTVFEGFSMRIEAGRSTALVGQSGSGKSTIIGLIERFYDPVKGVVKIDGRDVRSYHLQTLRRHVALVSQEPALFAGTIKENIAYGVSGEVSETEIVEAAKARNAHDFIAGLKEGYGTFCGDRGVQLSGGQKQQIAIARAILKNPAILLLDEATSALDSESEKVVQDALERVMVGRTSVVVAHRLSTIQSCDMIAVLEKGKLVETGSHNTLLAKGPKGAYYSLVNLQQASNSASDDVLWDEIKLHSLML